MYVCFYIVVVLPYRYYYYYYYYYRTIINYKSYVCDEPNHGFPPFVDVLHVEQRFVRSFAGMLFYVIAFVNYYGG